MMEILANRFLYKGFYSSWLINEANSCKWVRRLQKQCFASNAKMVYCDRSHSQASQWRWQSPALKVKQSTKWYVHNITSIRGCFILAISMNLNLELAERNNTDELLR